MLHFKKGSGHTGLGNALCVSPFLEVHNIYWMQSSEKIKHHGSHFKPCNYLALETILRILFLLLHSFLQWELFGNPALLVFYPLSHFKLSSIRPKKRKKKMFSLFRSWCRLVCFMLRETEKLKLPLFFRCGY